MIETPSRLTWVVSLLVTLVAGGLGGAVFTWYVQRPQATKLAYSLTTNVMGPDPTIISVVPKLKLQIGTEEIPRLYTHTLDFSVPEGPYIDQAEIAITLAPTSAPGVAGGTIRIFGVSADPPTPVHKLSCTLAQNVFRCAIGPLSPQHPAVFRVTFATDRAVEPKVVTASKGVQLIEATQLLKAQSRPRLDLFVKGVLAVAAAALAGTLTIDDRRARILGVAAWVGGGVIALAVLEFFVP